MTHRADKELDEYLRRESQVSERYRALEADDVPPALDAAVVAQARAAVAQPAKSQTRVSAWVRWGSPLALAASAVLIVAIVLEVGIQDELRVPAPQVTKGTASAERDAVLDSPSVAAPESFETSESQVAREVIERPLASLSQDTPAFAADPKPANPPQAAAAPSAVAPRPERARQAANGEQRASQPPAVNNARADKTADASTSARAGREAEALSRREAGEVVVTGQYVRSIPEEAAAPIAAIETQDLKSNDQTRPAFGPRAPGAPRTVSANARVMAAEPQQQYTTPESWLDAIRKLRTEGRHAEADEQWRVFRRTHPDFEVHAGDTALPQSQR